MIRPIFLIFFISIFLTPKIGFTQKSKHITLNNNNESYPLGMALDILEDPEKKWRYNDIISKGLSRSFTRSKEKTPNFGFTNSAYWVRFKIKNLNTEIEDWLLEIGYPHLDKIEIFYKNKHGEIVQSKSGDIFPFSQRKTIYRNVVFRLFFPSQTRQAESPDYVYLRFETQGTMQFPLTLWSPYKFAEKINKEVYGLGIYYGIMLVMVLYNLFIFFSIKDKSYLFYVLYIASYGILLMSANGLANEYLWANFPWWGNHSVPFFMALTSVFAMIFTQNYLHTNSFIPRFNLVLKGVMYYALVLIVLSLLLPYAISIKLAVILTLSFVTSVFTAGILCLRKGYKPARYFMLAWVVLLLGLIIYSLKQFGIFPSLFITEYGPQIGSAMEVILLSIGLADRINEFKRQTLEAEQKVVRNLMKVDKLKDEFLANTSHELRTPLNGIIGLAESLLDGIGGKLSKVSKKNLKMISSSGKRLSSLVNDILDYSKLKNRDLKLHFQPVDLFAITNVVLTLSESLIGKKNITLINQIPHDVPHAKADENRLQQILLNLVSNAIKFTDSGEVCIYAREKGDLLEIQVSDTGIGIPESEQENIFKPFEQVENIDTRKHQGTGLGLAITKQLIDLHNGTISVQSKPDEGAVFTMTLPVFTKDSIESSETFKIKDSLILENTIKRVTSDNLYDEPEKRSVPSYQFEENYPLNILIVDDEPINLQVLYNHLSLQNYKVTQANNGEHALELLNSNHESFDLVILDVMMPGMSGYQVCEKIRNTKPAHQLPIILLTAKNRVTDLVSGFEAGANDYITKPFSKNELLSRIKIHTQLLKTTRELEKAYHELFNTHDQLDQFTYRSAHDLKGPISRLIGLCYITKNESMGENASNYLSLMKNTAEEMNILLSRLLKMYDLRTKNIESEDVEIEQLIYSVWDKLSGKMDVENIDFLVHVPSKIIIKTDRKLLCALFENLLENAIRFKNNLRNSHLIQIDARDLGSEIQIKIKDDGIGISPEIQNRIFEMSVVGNELLKGAGLGLYEAQMISDKLKGKIELKNNGMNDSTEFLVSIPELEKPNS